MKTTFQKMEKKLINIQVVCLCSYRNFDINISFTAII